MVVGLGVRFWGKWFGNGGGRGDSGLGLGLWGWVGQNGIGGLGRGG